MKPKINKIDKPLASLTKKEKKQGGKPRFHYMQTAQFCITQHYQELDMKISPLLLGHINYQKLTYQIKF